MSTLSIPSRWYHVYQIKNTFAIDCEFVQKNKVNHLATVSIVNLNGRIVYEGKVYHEPGSFIVNKYTLALTGFREKDFLNGAPFDKVQQDVNEIIAGRDKLVITCGHKSDFKVLKLNPTSYNIFDLHDVYWCRINRGLSSEPVGLGRLCYKFFGFNPQFRSHSSTVDAQYTMKIFRETYLKSNLKVSRKNKQGFSLLDFPKLPANLKPF
jgi:DNA polymerase III epsilon subunit-like protein